MTGNDPLPERSRLQDLANFSGDPWTPKNKYFAAAEVHIEEIWRTLIFPFIADCDFSAVIDLGAGHGRNSLMLAPRAKRLLVLDIQPGNVEICRRRFAEQPHVACAVNNGFDLRPAEDGAFSLVYSFDSMVHFAKEVVRSYLRDTARVLRPGGRGFFHHSNYAGGSDWTKNPHARNHMSHELFTSYAGEAGLRTIQQMVFEWGHIPNLDCLTLVEKPK
jgi:SAM-dependent methyltransferase